ncbi:hypothetical protein ElyMa_006197300 [Elysia marginata]|uniref:Uncharacterized protein n=1 Tax=Elysia marginata TaxID=1093978 RepID=A0AAV4H295_9GAST|nr:hypothetical protein ElyMa_006197300 [Elysia marginata]
MEEKLINVASQNPFIIRGGDGVEISSTKLTISDLPISVASDTVETALIKKGLKMRSTIKWKRSETPTVISPNGYQADGSFTSTYQKQASKLQSKLGNLKPAYTTKS